VRNAQAKEVIACMRLVDRTEAKVFWTVSPYYRR
jgi:hypothetical protein